MRAGWGALRGLPDHGMPAQQILELVEPRLPALSKRVGEAWIGQLHLDGDRGRAAAGASRTLDERQAHVAELLAAHPKQGLHAGRRVDPFAQLHGGFCSNQTQNGMQPALDQNGVDQRIPHDDARQVDDPLDAHHLLHVVSLERTTGVGPNGAAGLGTLAAMSSSPAIGPVALAVDLGGTKVEAALVDPHGAILPDTRFRQPTGPTRSSDELAASVDTVVAQALDTLPVDAELIGVGIGSAGPIVVRDGAVSPLNLKAWRRYPLRAQVQALVQKAAPDVPVTLRMDGLCITLAEHWIGAAQGVDNVMGMVVSTGVGGGLILGGQTVAGPSGNAGHIGHIEVEGFDDPCPCGGHGCLEAIASGPHTVAWARTQGFTGATGEELGAAYAAGDEVAIRAVKRSATAVGHAIASATSLLDLELVAIGGGFSHVTPDFFDFIAEPIAERLEFDYIRDVRVVPSALSSDGPLVGAAALIHRAELVPAV